MSEGDPRDDIIRKLTWAAGFFFGWAEGYAMEPHASEAETILQAAEHWLDLHHIAIYDPEDEGSARDE